METNQHTEKLVKALIEAGAPQSMIERAREGRYDRTRTSIEQFPMKTLVDDARQHGLTGIGLSAMNGEFDAPRQDDREEL